MYIDKKTVSQLYQPAILKKQVSFAANDSRTRYLAERDREFEALFTPKPLITVPRTLLLAAVSLAVGLVASVVNQPAAGGGGRLPNNFKLPAPLFNHGLAPALVAAGQDRDLPQGPPNWNFDYEAPGKIRVKKRKKRKKLSKNN